MYLFQQRKKKIYFGNLKNYSKRINVKLPITKTTDIRQKKYDLLFASIQRFNTTLLFHFLPKKKKKRLQQAMVAQINNVQTAANMLNLFLDAIISTSTMLFEVLFFFNIFFQSFNLWCLPLIIAFYYQTKTPINFWIKRGLNFRSLI